MFDRVSTKRGCGMWNTDWQGHVEFDELFFWLIKGRAWQSPTDWQDLGLDKITDLWSGVFNCSWWRLCVLQIYMYATFLLAELQYFWDTKWWKWEWRHQKVSLILCYECWQQSNLHTLRANIGEYFVVTLLTKNHRLSLAS